MVNTPGVADHAADEPDGTADPTRPSPVITAANGARNALAPITGVLTLLSGAGLVTAVQLDALNLGIAVLLAAVPVLVTVGGQLLAAARTIREAWPKVTPVDSPRRVIDGRLVPLIPAFDVRPPGAPRTP